MSEENTTNAEELPLEEQPIENLEVTAEEADPKRLVDIIVPEARVNILISTGFYQKIREIGAFITEGKTADDLNDAFKQISEQKITDAWVQNFETVVILCKEFESQAKIQGFVKPITQEEVANRLKEGKIGK